MAFIFKALQRNGIISEDSSPLVLQSPQKNCRDSRSQSLQTKTKILLSYISRFFFWSSGYNKRFTKCSQLYCIYLFIVCWYQVVYEIYKIAGCPEFTCSITDEVIGTTLEFEFVSYLSAAIGSACSYTMMLLSLNMLYKRNSNGITPYKGLKDMSNSKAKVTFIMVSLSCAVFCAYFILFLFIAMNQNKLIEYRMVLYTISVLCEFIAQWVGMVSLYAFSCSTFAIGTFAADTLRRIQSVTSDSIDDVIKIHKELRSIVRETTDAYSGWFLLHWLIYGVTVILGFVVVALHKFGHDEVERKVCYGMFFAMNLFYFVFPCVCAAYVTSTCGSICRKINNTTSEDWEEGHLFQDRRNLQMFVSYCSASPICFKIGRITFTSTLAWFSFFFGSTGLLFHFFSSK